MTHSTTFPVITHLKCGYYGQQWTFEDPRLSRSQNWYNTSKYASNFNISYYDSLRMWLQGKLEVTKDLNPYPLHPPHPVHHLHSYPCILCTPTLHTPTTAPSIPLPSTPYPLILFTLPHTLCTLNIPTLHTLPFITLCKHSDWLWLCTTANQSTGM